MRYAWLVLCAAVIGCTSEIPPAQQLERSKSDFEDLSGEDEFLELAATFSSIAPSLTEEDARDARFYAVRARARAGQRDSADAFRGLMNEEARAQHYYLFGQDLMDGHRLKRATDDDYEKLLESLSRQLAVQAHGYLGLSSDRDLDRELSNLPATLITEAVRLLNEAMEKFPKHREAFWKLTAYIQNVDGSLSSALAQCGYLTLSSQ